MKCSDNLSTIGLAHLPRVPEPAEDPFLGIEETACIAKIRALNVSVGIIASSEESVGELWLRKLSK